MKKLWIVLVLVVLVVVGMITIFFLVLFPIKNRQFIKSIANKYDLEFSLVLSVINIESGWDEKAKSSSGALGLMQILPSTAKEVANKIGIIDFDVEDLYDKKTNIEIGCYYLNYLLDVFNGSEVLALCAYNAGPNKVQEWLDNEKYSDGKTIIKIPYRETENYVKKAKLNKKIYNFILQL